MERFHSIYDCTGCGDPIIYGEHGNLWCNHPLGMCTLKVHKDQNCARLALEKNPEHKLMKGNKPPMSAKEKMKSEPPRSERV